MDCYTCKYRRSVPGSAHSSCAHKLAEVYKPIAFLNAIELKGSTHPFGEIEVDGKQFFELDPVGIRGGWALWPFNFDPTWVKSCAMYDNQESSDTGD